MTRDKEPEVVKAILDWWPPRLRDVFLTKDIETGKESVSFAIGYREVTLYTKEGILGWLLNDKANNTQTTLFIRGTKHWVPKDKRSPKKRLLWWPPQVGDIFRITPPDEQSVETFKFDAETARHWKSKGRKGWQEELEARSKVELVERDGKPYEGPQ